MRHCCNYCDDDDYVTRRALNVERCGCLILGLLIGATTAAIITTWLCVTYLK